MAIIADSKEPIYEEEVGYRAAVSESTGTKIGGAINYILNNASDYIGQVEMNALTEAQFATIKSYDYTETDLTIKQWVKIDGQNITGSDYATLTGITSLPSANTNGAFPRMATSEGNLLTYQSNQNKLHTHTTTVEAVFDTGNPGSYQGFDMWRSTADNDQPDIPYVSTSDGGSEARPNAVQVSMFLRINN